MSSTTPPKDTGKDAPKDEHKPEHANSTEAAPAKEQDLLQGIANRMRLLGQLLGATAAIASILLVAGFLSEFAVYRLAGLPRLSFNYTSLTETGAEVLIDILSALAAGGRPWVLSALLLTIVVCWWQANNWRWLRRITTSKWLYASCRVLLFGCVAWLLAGEVSFVQSQLSRANNPEASGKILEQSYAQDNSKVPNPRERLRGIEQAGYQIPYFPWANWENRWIHSETPLAWEQLSGVPLRQLPESRLAARNVFGWLTLLTLVMVMAGVLLGKWWSTLNPEPEITEQDTPAEPASGASAAAKPADSASEENNDTATSETDDTQDDKSCSAETADAEEKPESTHDSSEPSPANVPRPSEANSSSSSSASAAPSSAPAHSAPAHVSAASAQVNEPVMQLLAPLHYLLAPLTLVASILLIMLLPLCHGLLARASLGHETVLVTLDTKAKKPANGQKPDAPLQDSKCGTVVRSSVSDAQDAYREALRDMVQLRSAAEREEYKQAKTKWDEKLTELADKIINSQCLELASSLWELRPPYALLVEHPHIADSYRSQSQRVYNHYQLRVGTLLNYPRDKEALTLIDTIQPRLPGQDGQWALTSYERAKIQETVVLPDTWRRTMENAARSLTQNADNTDALKLILRSQDAAALEATLTLLNGRFLHTSHAGVAVTALGGQAQANALERPDLSIRAIDTLIDLASAKPSAVWPNKSLRIRGAAATALHLSRSPYAAYRLAERLRAESGPTYTCTGSQPGVGCLPQTYTAAGFLLSDLTAESRMFSRVSIAIPAALDRSRDSLLTYLLDATQRTDLSSEMRGAACAGLKLSGVRKVAQKQAEAFLASLKGMDASREGIVLNSCLNTISMMKMDYPAHREFLRALFLRDDLGDLTPRLHRIALVTLSELGLEQESAWLAHAYQQVPDDSEEKDLLEKILNEAEQESLGKALLSCVSEQRSQNPTRARRCLEGMRHMKEHYDGDSGAAAQLIAWLRAGDTPALKTEFCQVLEKFKARNGNEAKLWWGKHGQQQCGNSHAQEPTSEAALRRALLERLGGSL